MLRKIGALFLLFLFFTFLYLDVSIKLNLLRAPLRKVLNENSLNDVSFGDIRFKFFNRISVSRVTFKDSLSFNEVIVRINPILLVKNMKHPQFAIDAVDLDGAKVVIDENVRDLLTKNSEKAGGTTPVIRELSFRNCNLKYGDHEFDRVRGKVCLAGGYSGKISGHTQGNKFVLEGTVSQHLAKYSGSISIGVTGAGLEAGILSAFSGVIGGDVEANVRIPKLTWRDFSLNDSIAKVRYAGDETRVRFFSRAGRGELSISKSSGTALSLDIILDSIVKDVSGKLNCRIQKNKDSVNGFLYLTNLYYQKKLIGNSRFELRTNKNKMITGSGTVLPAGYSFELSGRPDKEFRIKGRSKDRNSSLDILVNTADAGLELNILKWPLKDMPVVSVLYPGIQGRLSAKGSGEKGKTEINVSVENCSFRDSGATSFVAHILGTKAGLFFDLNSSDKSIRLSGKSLRTGFWDISGVLEKASLKKYSPWALLPVKTEGLVSGSFYVDSEKNGYIRASAFKLNIADHLFDSARISADLNPDAADINYFALHSGRGTLTGSILIGLNPYWGSSSLNLTFFKFPYRNNIIEGKLAVKGNIFNDERLHLMGGMEGSGLKYADWKAKSLKAVIDLSKDDIQIKNLDLDSYLTGDINLAFAKKAISGSFYLNNFPLAYLSRDADGLVNGTLSIKKTLEDPEIGLNYSVQGAKYKKYGFSSSANLIYKNKNLSGEKISVSSGTTSIILEGDLWPELRLKGKVDYFSMSLIQDLIEREIPISGGFTGQISITDSFKNPRIGADIRAIGLYYKDVAIPQFVGTLSFQDGNINIEKFYTKYEDSEIFLSKGSFISLKDNKFKMHSELRNCRAGPVCVFGKLGLEGDFYQREKKYGVRGMAETQGFWLNQRNLAKARIGFDLFGNTVTFGRYLKYSSLASGSIDLGKWPKVQFNNFRMGESKNYLEIDGSMAPKWSEFSVHTRKLPGETLSDLVEMPMDVLGSIDSAIAFKGTVDKPSISGKITVSSGSLAEMPFGRMELNFRIKDDMLKIFDSGIAQKDRNNITLEGTVPFFLTVHAKKRVLKKKIELTLAIEKESLSSLNGLTQDISFVKGDLEASLNLTGTVLKPTWNGNVWVSGGEMDSKQYVKKVKDLNIDLSLKNNILKINQFSGKIGRGTARLSGTVAFEEFVPKKFNVHFVTEGDHGVSVSIPELPIPTPLVKTTEESVFSNLSHGEPKADLKLIGTMKNLTLAGWIELENTRFTYPSLVKSEPTESPMDAVWPMLNLNVEFRSAKNTSYDNELASINVGGSIKLTGKADNIIVNGKIEGLHGAVQYFGADFEIRSCLLEVVNNEVYLQAEATNESYISNETIPDVITMTIPRAEISKIKPHFSSKDNGDLTSEKALARATRMDPSLYQGKDETFIMQRQLIRVIDSSLATPLARNILRKSGLVDTFNVHYVEKSEAAVATPGQPTLTELLYGTKYSVQKYLTNQVQFGYSLIFDRLQDKLAFRHEVELSYKWTKNIFVTGSYQLDNKELATEPEKKISIAEVFRFGGPKKKAKAAKKTERSQAEKSQAQKVLEREVH